MRRLIAIALLVAGAAVPVSVCAQRGGGARGGSMGHGSSFGGGFASHGGASFGGGFSGRSAPVFRGSSTAIGRPSFTGQSPVGASRYAGGAPHGIGIGLGARPGYTNRRPVYPLRDRYRRPWVPVYGLSVPYAVAGWYGANCGWNWDCGDGYYEDGGLDYAYVSSEAAPPADYSADPNTPPVEPVGAAPADAFRPAYRSPQPEPQPEEDAVTLIFKDGRPNQQIHNYMLTRTTLYVQDERQREIPIADLDLAATEKVNKDAGVAFQLPGTAR